MVTELMDKPGLKEGIAAGLPVFAGYFPIALTFGLMAASINISLRETMAFSVFVFAGASQFVALNMIQSGAGAAQIGLAVFMLNIRHLLMSTALSSKLEISRPAVPVIAFGITDETFAVSSMRSGTLTGWFMAGLNFTSYAGWVSGTAAGYLAGDFIPPMLRDSMSICLYALFVAILVPGIKKVRSAGITAFIAAGFNSLLSYTALLDAGWNIIISIITACILSFIFIKGE